MIAEVDKYISEADKWQEEMKLLQAISLECGLTEELKWGKPCYSYEENNIVIVQPFKDSCALMFFKGVLLDDPNNILEKPGENSRVARRISFTNIQRIEEMNSTIKAYIQEAIEVEKAGLEVNFEEKKEPIPEEFQKKMDESPDLQAAFKALTPGRQRGYLLHFSDAKQSKTRERRVEKYIPKILEGKGINER